MNPQEVHLYGKDGITGKPTLELRIKLTTTELNEITPLLPGQWVKWVFTSGVDISDQVNNLKSCSIFIKYPTHISTENHLTYKVRGELLNILKEQVKSNKRNWS